jgi:hypothetical protein
LALIIFTMRGQTFSSFALVAFAISVSAAPLVVRTDDLLEARQPHVLAERDFSVGKVGVVAVGQEFERRQASSTSKPAAGGAKATTPADLPAW